jgi:hypothetical protein
MPVDGDVAWSGDPNLYVAIPNTEYCDFNLIPDYETLFLFPCKNQHPVVPSKAYMARVKENRLQASAKGENRR